MKLRFACLQGPKKIKLVLAKFLLVQEDFKVVFYWSKSYNYLDFVLVESLLVQERNCNCGRWWRWWKRVKNFNGLGGWAPALLTYCFRTKKALTAM